MPAGGSGGVSALQHRRDRQRGKRCLLATKAPPTPPQRWRARSKGAKQISMTICTTASTDVHSLCSRATSDPVAFQNKTRDQTEFPQFSVKRPFQDETSLTPADHEPGQWFAAYADRGLLSSLERRSSGERDERQTAAWGRCRGRMLRPGGNHESCCSRPFSVHLDG